MKSNKLRIAAMGCAAVLFSTVLAFSGSDSVTMTVTPIGYGSFEFGEIMRGVYAGGSDNNEAQNHFWMQKGLLDVGMKVERSDNWSIILSGQASLTWPWSQPSEGGSSANAQNGEFTPLYSWYFDEADLRYSLGGGFHANWPSDPANKSQLQIDVGYFPFKYNADARDFGEYLFRINSYPQYLVTQFDTDYKRLLGLRISSLLAGVFRQDLLLTSEVDLLPMEDYSLAYMFNYDVKCNARKFGDIGGGIMGNRCLSIDHFITTPSAVTNPNDFSFASVKLMAKASLDIKSFMPDLPRAIGLAWGENDFKLYSELCLNGYDDYKLDSAKFPYLYPLWANKQQRLPIMIGFNVPTLKLLDVLSVEVEWWNNKFSDNYYNEYFGNGYTYAVPSPVQYGQMGLSSTQVNPWHWSVFVQKAIAKDVNIKFQAARDHLFFPVSQQQVNTQSFYDDLAAHGDWAWDGKIEWGVNWF